jgi:hypothetical protein
MVIFSRRDFVKMMPNGSVAGARATCGRPFAAAVAVQAARERTYPAPMVDGDTLTIARDRWCAGCR